MKTAFNDWRHATGVRKTAESQVIGACASNVIQHHKQQQAKRKEHGT